jgi:hypothetical protein
MNSLSINLNSASITNIGTSLLVLVGLFQIFILFTQNKQNRIALTENYRQLWNNYKIHWGNVVFISREPEEYYQILDEKSIKELKFKTKEHRLDIPTVWALESTQKVFGILGEISTRILQGHLKVADIYPIFGSQFLRQSNPLRNILEPDYSYLDRNHEPNEHHELIRKEIQNWLIYHDGIRRRSLILIDLLWAEASRLEDLPPYDLKNAADAKRKTGQLNRKRVRKESNKINGYINIFYAFKFSWFLRKAEYETWLNWWGINEKKLNKMDKEWTKLLLREKY